MIKTVGIIGAGTMGRRIAFACILGKRRTAIFDIAPGVADRAITAVRDLIRERVRDARLPNGSENAMSLLSVALSLQSCVENADLAVETVSENVELKRSVFRELDRYIGADTLILTNTSSIPGSWLASVTRCPERIFNCNFGHADFRKVEVMGNPQTSSTTLREAETFLRELGLVPVFIKGELMGYASPRVWRAVKKEVLKLVDQGHITAEDVDRGWMLDWGSSIGPCGLMDAIGLDVVRDIEMIYFEASGDPSDRPPPLLERMVAEGKLGVKTGVGFYTYPDPPFRREGWLEGEETTSVARQ